MLPYLLLPVTKFVRLAPNEIKEGSTAMAVLPCRVLTRLLCLPDLDHLYGTIRQNLRHVSLRFFQEQGNSDQGDQRRRGDDREEDLW